MLLPQNFLFVFRCFYFFVAVGFFWSSWSFFQVRDTDTATIMGKAGLEVQKPANSIEHAEVQGEEMQK